MSYRIIFKGGQIGDEFVGEVEGSQISNAWEHNRLIGKVKINGNLYDATSIKAILSGFQNPDKTDKHEETKRMMRDMWRDYEDNKNRALSQPIEERAKRTGQAEMLYVSLCGHLMPPEIKELVVEAQLVFFKKNPNYSIAKPSCYKDLLMPYRRTGPYHIGGLAASTALSFAERVTAASMPE